MSFQQLVNRYVTGPATQVVLIRLHICVTRCSIEGNDLRRIAVEKWSVDRLRVD